MRRACMSEVHSVRLSRRSCMMRVLSLYDSSPSVSSSAIASSKACVKSAQLKVCLRLSAVWPGEPRQARKGEPTCLAKWQARSGEFRIS